VIGPQVDLYSVDNISVGRDCIVSQKAFLCTASHDINSPQFDLVSGPIVLQDNCWVAARAFIGPGVTLASGAVVGACSVVVWDVGRQQVVGGNPARQIGLRAESGRNFLR
jgi:putative colanic acid biosynthesis acetyltransferase WcaF